MNNKKEKACASIIVFASILLLRSCNSNLNKEQKQGIVVEPPKIEEIKFEDIYTPVPQDELDKKFQEMIDNNSPEISTETKENRRK